MADRVVFTRPDAARIANAVRKVEEGSRDEAPLRFGRVNVERGGGGKVFRIGTFTGAWDVGATKTVTFKYVTSTPNTVTAINLFLNLPSDGTKDCAIAKDAGTWHLVQWQWVTITCSTAA